MGERRGPYKTLVGKSEGIRPLRRPRRRLKDSTTISGFLESKMRTHALD
jgi:hypothetical protein